MALEPAARSWGDSCITLSLPGTRLRVSGLSVAQRGALAEQYPGFTSASGDWDLECRGLQLRAWQPPDAASLTRDGQYTPRKRRAPGGAGFELTGHDFSAYLDPANSDSPSRVGVVRESDLPSPVVFENVLRVLLAHRALAAGGILLHSAGLVIDGLAYIFCGRSNAGKTTLTRKAHRAGLTVLSDDINLLLPAGDGYRAHAVPFTGEFGRGSAGRARPGRSYPVAALLLLQQAGELGVEPASPAIAAADLLAGSPFVNMDPDESHALFDAVTGLLDAVPVLHLKNRRQDSVADIMASITSKLPGSSAP